MGALGPCFLLSLAGGWYAGWCGRGWRRRNCMGRAYSPWTGVVTPPRASPWAVMKRAFGPEDKGRSGSPSGMTKKEGGMTEKEGGITERAGEITDKEGGITEKAVGNRKAGGMTKLQNGRGKEVGKDEKSLVSRGWASL